MRGNEIIATCWTNGMIWFPIPMRGNEGLLIWQDSARVLAFPIPMRGNEPVRPVPGIRPALVSDPHEG